MGGEFADTGLADTERSDSKRADTERSDSEEPPGGSVSEARIEVADGISLNVRSRAGRRRPFILVHGLASNARLWDETAADLAGAGHPVYAIDLRSHGTSDTPPDGYDTATAADDVATVARRLGITGAVLAGQSWGGNVIVEVAARHPRVAAALALVDGGWFQPSDAFTSRSEWASAARPPSVDGIRSEDLRARLTRDHPGWSAAAVDATMANLAGHPDGTVTRRLSIDNHMRIALDMWDSPPSRFYSRVLVPVVLIPALPGDPAAAAARHDRVAAAAKSLPDATIREYAGADHDIHAQFPRELAADLIDLATSLEQEA